MWIHYEPKYNDYCIQSARQLLSLWRKAGYTYGLKPQIFKEACAEGKRQGQKPQFQIKKKNKTNQTKLNQTNQTKNDSRLSVAV